MSYRLRYSDIAASLQAADKALSLSADDPDSRAEALCGKAYVCYQQMRYDQALHFIARIRQFSRNQIELLCADVLAMKIMQRTGDGKAFFDYRLSAAKRLRRILSEQNALTPHQRRRFHYAVTEYHIVGSTYYYYLGQDSAARSEIRQAAQYVSLPADTAQWLYYHYMIGSGGLSEGSPDEVTTTEFDDLFRVYTLAKASGSTYFEANALQSLAVMVCDSARNACLRQSRQDAYTFLIGEHRHWKADSMLGERHALAVAMARHSETLFRQYRDLYQTASALRTMGEVYFDAQRYAESLRYFHAALHLASCHNRSPYSVTPWLAAIHENLSLAYSALGDKQMADDHRNTYLDLLDASRQNRELDSRKALLGKEVRREHMQFLLLILLVVSVAVLSVAYYRQLRRRSRSAEMRLCSIGESEAAMQALRWLQQRADAAEERLEECREENRVAKQRLAAQHERHVMQCAKLSAVYAVIPYLDRVIAEARKLADDGTDVGTHLSYIHDLCAGMMSINERLTAWIQMQQGRPGLQVTRFPLNDVLHVISMQQYAFAKQGLTLLVPATELKVKADRPLTLFMVNTLVDNARKFTPSGGTVSVVLDATDAYVEVSVCDTGVGLSPEDVRTLNESKIYDPERVGMTKEGKGFGFGIANCRGIINSYRKLSPIFSVCAFGVESEQGRGSRFWFRLPRVLTLLLLLLCSLCAPAMPQRCYALFDSTYIANLQGRYADACLLSDSAIRQAEAPVDTPLLVSLYNERAIAAQALGRWETYRRSNAECVRLHRLYSIDGSLASDCQRLEKMTADSRVLYALIVVLLVASLVLFYRVVLRRRLRQHASLEGLHLRLTDMLNSLPETASELEEQMQAIVHSLAQPRAKHSVGHLQEMLVAHMKRAEDAQAAIGGEEEKVQRLHFEHDRLYVMNQIMDNSLSTIKHETMYFPARIQQMADAMQREGTSDNACKDLLDMVVYYRYIYMLLYEQAHRQADQSPLRLKPIALARLFDYARQTYGVACVNSAAWVRGDERLLRLLFDQLLSLAPSCTLSAEEKDGFVCVQCDVAGSRLTPEQCAGMFSPPTGQLAALAIRQIVREHDVACGHPGLRLEASGTAQGYRILFSLMATT